jgi:hypothetical protein
MNFLIAATIRLERILRYRDFIAFQEVTRADADFGDQDSAEK